MAPGPEKAVIVIRRRRRHHRAHHGGAWKVAYADFVTAMMAFFLVMWLIAQNSSIKKAVADYFKNPGAFDHAQSNGVLPGSRAGVDTSIARRDMVPNRPLEAERRLLTEAAERIRQDLLKVPDVAGLRDQIEFTLTAEGLRIELVDRTGSSFFNTGSAVLLGESERILTVIAREVGKLTNDLAIEGHTDSRPYALDTGYGNWDLSVDRANAARRVMQQNGLGPGQLRVVRGFADTQLHLPGQPLDPRNRRVSIVVRSVAAEVLNQAIGQSVSGQPAGAVPDLHR